jgi:hypothetical protein
MQEGCMARNNLWLAQDCGENRNFEFQKIIFFPMGA